MQYNNYKLEVDFVIPAGWLLLDDEDGMMEELGMSEDEAVMTAFVAVKEGAKTAKDVEYITATHDMEVFETEDDYARGLEENIEELKNAGATVSNRETTKTPNGFRVDRITITANGINMIQYYLYINELLVCFAGENDEAMRSIVFSAQKEA